VLDNLNDIEWAALSHACGSAENVPGAIGKLASEQRDSIAQGLSELYDCICHQACSVYEATAPAIPFLLELLRSPSVNCRARILYLLGNIARVASPGDPRPDQYVRALDSRYFDTAEQACRDAIWEGFDVLCSSLVAFDSNLRRVAPFTIAQVCGYPNEQIPVERQTFCRNAIEQMVRQLAEEPDGVIRASVVFGLAELAERYPETVNALQPLLREHSQVVRIAAATCLMEIQRDPPRDAVDILIDALHHWQQTDQLFGPGRNTADPDDDFCFPWFDTSPRFRLIRQLCNLPPTFVSRVTPALLSPLKHATENTVESVSAPILKFVLGEMTITEATTAADLSIEQRSVLEVFYENAKMWRTTYADVKDQLSSIGLTDKVSGRPRLARLLGMSDSSRVEGSDSHGQNGSTR
jgi:hypothetical protein